MAKVTWWPFAGPVQLSWVCRPFGFFTLAPNILTCVLAPYKMVLQGRGSGVVAVAIIMLVIFKRVLIDQHFLVVFLFFVFEYVHLWLLGDKWIDLRTVFGLYYL